MDSSERKKITNLDEEMGRLWNQGIKCLQQVQNLLRAKHGQERARLWIVVWAEAQLVAYDITEEIRSPKDSSMEKGISTGGIAVPPEQFQSIGPPFGEQNVLSDYITAGALPKESAFLVSTKASLGSLADLSKGYQILDTCLGTLGPTRDLSGRTLTELLPTVRRSLHSGAYSWPEAARQKFRELGHSSLPARPKEKGFKPEVTLQMLALCCLVSKEWQNAVHKSAGSVMLSKGREKKVTASARSVLENKDRSKTTRKVSVSLRSKHILDKVLGPRTARVDQNRSALSGRRQISAMDTMDRRLVSHCRSAGNWKSLEQVVQNTHTLFLPPRTSQTTLCLLDVPPDGSCLFYAVMLGAYKLGLPTVQDLTCSLLRKKLSLLLKEFSQAGRPGSRFRREWLRAAVSIISPEDMAEMEHPISDKHRREIFAQDEARRKLWESGMHDAELSDDIHGFEVASAGLRVYIQKYADQIAARKWGGSFALDLPLLATIIGTGIEIYTYNGVCKCDKYEDKDKSVDKYEEKDNCVCSCEDKEVAWDTRTRATDSGQLVPISFRALYVPEELHMPQNNTFVAAALRSAMSGRSSQLPIIKLYLNNFHYMLCDDLGPSEGKCNARWIPTQRPHLAAPFTDLNCNERKILETALTEGLNSGQSDLNQASSLSEGSISREKPFVVIDGCRIGSQQVLRLRTVPRSQQWTIDLWIDDEIINAYSHLLRRRSTFIASQAHQNGTKPPPSTFFCHTFFFSQIVSGAAHREVERHAPFSYRLILMPFQVDGNHWVLAILNTAQHTVQLYDPKGNHRSEDAARIRQWAQNQTNGRLGEWVISKFGSSADENEGFDIPKQTNVVDCGIFVCKAMESFCLEAPLAFHQGDMVYVRRRMSIELLTAQAADLHPSRISLPHVTD